MSIPARRSRGFTLIELLVVIAIIGLLASIILVSLQSARVKARDARREADLQSIQTALALYYDNKGSMPANPVPGSGVCDTGSTLSTDPYNSVMQKLVDAKVLPSIPHAPASTISGYQSTYCYYDYGQSYSDDGEQPGVMLVTQLESAPPSTDGYPGTCRPFKSGDNNWCTKDSNQYYCLCYPY